MIRKTVYFRDEEDLAKFNAIKNKAEWLHLMLNEDIEEYKPIPGYEGRYSITSTGRIWSHPRPRVRGSIINAHLGERGYWYVRLSKDGKNMTTNVHRLIAQAWLPNPDNLPQVNHINGIKTDNRLENLEWCDGFYNQQEARRLGLHTQVRGEQHGNSKLTEIQVAKIITYKTLDKPTKEIASLYGVDEETIRGIWRGNSWKHMQPDIISEPTITEPEETA